MSLTTAANRLAQLGARLERAGRDWKSGSVRDLVRIARKWSDGRLSLKDLRRMGHPYARRHGTPRLNPAMINRQTGAFYNAWEPDPQADEWTAAIHNTDPKAELYLQPGTSRMFARPVDAEILAEAAPEIDARLRYLLERAFR